jgi:hypothetical protein
MKFRLINLTSILLLSLQVFAQENRVSKDEDLQNVFSGTWDLRTFDNTIETNFDDNVTDAPIDGGLGFLLAAGVGYYANGVRKRRRQKNQNDSEGKNGDK